MFLTYIYVYIGSLLPLSDAALLNTILTELLPPCIPDMAGQPDLAVVDSYIQRYPGAVTWFAPGSYEKRPRTVVHGVSNLFCAGDLVVMASETDDRVVSPYDLSDQPSAVAPLMDLIKASTRGEVNLLNPFDTITHIAKSSTSTNKPTASVAMRRSRSDKVGNTGMGFNTEEHGSKGLCQERAYVSGIFAANKLTEHLKINVEKEVVSSNIIPIREDEPQVKLGREVNKRVSSVLERFGVKSSFWLR